MIFEQPIPVYTSLTDVFGTLEGSLTHAIRWNNLSEEFKKRFGKNPTYITRAPGRVNLIGEHVDYALFGVLPAAVELDILIACAPRSAPSIAVTEISKETPGTVVAENLHPKYTRQEFSPAARVPEEVGNEEAHAEAWYLDINPKELRWESYVKAGYYGVLNHHFFDREQSPLPVDLLVTGTVPAGSGLSSSAAMVVASTLAFLAVNGKLDNYPEIEGRHVLNKGELVQLAMENEKRVGVNSGGMDQAASVMSDPSSALYISFYPSLTASAVPLPSRAVIVCANSLIVADKALTAKRRYNVRVVETLVAARILAKSLGLEIGRKDRITLREVAGKFAGEEDGHDMGPEKLEKVLVALEQKLEILKPKNLIGTQLGVTMGEMRELTGLSKDIFDEVYLSWVDIEATHFQLYKRAKHVFSEARRVLQFRQACFDAEASDTDNGVSLQRLGGLMNDSQFSCAELFECSCLELDQLTHIAREAGAYGSRLTGAGWGGCTVSLVPEGQVSDFIQKVKRMYPPYKNLDGDALNGVIFSTKPGSGACVFKL